MNFIVCNEKGEILRAGSCQAAMLYRQAGTGEYAIKGVGNDLTQYVDVDTAEIRNKHTIQARFNKTTILGDGVDSIIIANLPIPSTVTLDGVRYEVDDGEFEFTVDMPGEYAIKIKALHHLAFETTVTAQ